MKQRRNESPWNARMQIGLICRTQKRSDIRFAVCEKLVFTSASVCLCFENVNSKQQRAESPWNARMHLGFICRTQTWEAGGDGSRHTDNNTHIHFTNNTETQSKRHQHRNRIPKLQNMGGLGGWLASY